MVTDNIKRLCKEKGMKVSELERQVNISKGYIYNMKNPTVGTLEKIAKALDVDVCELIE